MKRRWQWIMAAAVTTASTLALAGTALAQPGPAANVTPGAVYTSSGSYVFYTAADGSVWNKVVGGAEGSATSIGGRLVSAPSAVSSGGNIFVFGQGTDNSLWYTTCSTAPGPNASCGTWYSLGGVITSKPGAAAIDTAGDLAVFARGSDGAVWARYFGTADGWGGWQAEGGTLLAGTGPSATADGNHEWVLVAGTDETMWMDELSPTGTTGFVPVGGYTTQSPAITTSDTYASGLTGFATGTNGGGYWANLSTGTGWKSMGGNLTSGVAGITESANNAVAFGLGTSGQVYYNGITGTTWTEVTP